MTFDLKQRATRRTDRYVDKAVGYDIERRHTYTHAEGHAFKTTLHNKRLGEKDEQTLRATISTGFKHGTVENNRQEKGRGRAICILHIGK